MAYLTAFSVWVLPLLFAITFHEAAHGFVARALGDDTAAKLGRVSLNPIKHIDPFGTALLPALLVLTGSPFLFGYAKPVPIKFRALHPQRTGMILVAAAGPLTNLALAFISAAAFHLLASLPPTPALWLAQNLEKSILVNVFLGVFNLFPIPPLDGGRIAVAVLPQVFARALSWLEPYGVALLLVLLVVLPAVGARMGYDFGFISHAISFFSQALIRAILYLTRNT